MSSNSKLGDRADDVNRNKSFKLFPKNIKVLFAFASMKCDNCNRRLTAAEIFRHKGMNLDDWLR